MNIVASQYRIGDIKTHYHPRSGKAPIVQSLKDYNAAEEQLRKPPPPAEDPWRPYRTRSDFEFADIALDACLNEKQTEALIKLIHHVVSGHDQFTISGYSELRNLRKSASALLTPVRKA